MISNTRGYLLHDKKNWFIIKSVGDCIGHYTTTQQKKGAS